MKYLLILTMLASLGCASNKKSVDADINNYRELAEKIVSYAKTKNPNHKVLRKDADKLISLAMPILDKFAKINPQCKSYLKTVKKKTPGMKRLSLEQIEHKFHEGHALPKAADRCSNAKELVVHPATVYIIGKKKVNTEGKEQVVDELDEVLAHLDLLLEY